MAMPEAALGPLKALATAILIGSAFQPGFAEKKLAKGLVLRCHNSSVIAKMDNNTAIVVTSSVLRGSGRNDAQRVGLIMISRSDAHGLIKPKIPT